MNDRPTPETDEQINGKPCTRFSIAVGDSLRDALVPSEFARKLERERDEAREKYFTMRDLHTNATELAEKYKRERDELKEALLIMENLLKPGIELFPEIGELLKVKTTK